MAGVIMVNGSPNAASRLNGIVSHVRRRLALGGHAADEIRVADLPAQDLVLGRSDNPEIREAVGRVERADAVIFASPVYKASYTGLLKLFLDVLPQHILADKWVAPVFMGGTIAHLLAVEFAFKPVAAALGARRFAPSVYAVDVQVTRAERNGDVQFDLDDELKKRLDAMLDELVRELEAPVPSRSRA
nr:NADPH-dependent FMN reductase [Thermobacillus sp. ZCTH02-B1]